MTAIPLAAKVAGLAIGLWLGLALDGSSATPAGRSLRIKPGLRTAPLTNAAARNVTTTVSNQAVRVRVPANQTLMVARGGIFTPAEVTRSVGTNREYDLRLTDVFATLGARSSPVALSTKPFRLPDTFRTVINGTQIEGGVEVSLQSELMVYNPDSREYEGMLDVCFRSSAPPAQAQRLVPINLRLHHSPDLHLSTNALTIAAVGNAGCRDVSIRCSPQRGESKVTVKLDSGTEQDFFIQFEEVPLWETFKTPLVILGGIALGALGGYVRSWNSRGSRQV